MFKDINKQCFIVYNWVHERTNGLTEQKSSINKRFIRTIFELENERKRRQTNEFKILPKDWKKHERNRSFI